MLHPEHAPHVDDHAVVNHKVLRTCYGYSGEKQRRNSGVVDTAEKSGGEILDVRMRSHREEVAPYRSWRKWMNERRSAKHSVEERMS